MLLHCPHQKVSQLPYTEVAEFSTTSLYKGLRRLGPQTPKSPEGRGPSGKEGRKARRPKAR